VPPLHPAKASRIRSMGFCKFYGCTYKLGWLIGMPIFRLSTEVHEYTAKFCSLIYLKVLYLHVDELSEEDVPDVFFRKRSKRQETQLFS
jgi:hypothetical protein